MAAQVIVLAVPFQGLEELLDECADALRDKPVLEVVNALKLAGGVFRATPPAEGSVAAHILARAPSARIVSGLKHQSAAKLRAVDRRLEGDVLLCGDDEEAKRLFSDLIRRMPDLRPIDAGGLGLSSQLDQVTALLLNLNRRYRTETSLRIVGL
jgi:NADPH-dependent F420 reductase